MESHCKHDEKVPFLRLPLMGGLLHIDL